MHGASLIGGTGISAMSYTGTSEMHYAWCLIDRRCGTRNSAMSYTGTSEMHYTRHFIERRYRNLLDTLHRYLRDALYRTPH